MEFGEILSPLLINLQSIFRKNISFKGASFQQLIGIIALENDGMEMSEFAKKIGVDNSTATRMISGLENNGWVIRKKYSKDKRIIKVSLTISGKDIQTEVENQFTRTGKIIQGEIPEDNNVEILEALSYLNWVLLKIKMNKKIV